MGMAAGPALKLKARLVALPAAVDEVTSDDSLRLDYSVPNSSEVVGEPFKDNKSFQPLRPASRPEKPHFVAHRKAFSGDSLTLRTGSY
jgi:hypothetical protein